MINIVKYANRKLYSKNFSRYITLNEMIGLIRANKEIKITDHLTKKDITKDSLKQALLEIDLSEKEILDLMRK